MTDQGTHTESEDHGWDIRIGDHPPRKDSPEYRQARAVMVRLLPQAPSVMVLYFGVKRSGDAQETPGEGGIPR